MRVALINPSLVVQKNDPFTTGIVFMPIMLAYVASMMKNNDIEVSVIDAFGEAPQSVRCVDRFWIFGMSPSEVIDRIPEDTSAVFVYAINLTNHLSTIRIIQVIKEVLPQMPVVVLENAQAVTAYSLRAVAGEFYNAGADYILCGDHDHTAVDLVKCLQENKMKELRDILGLGSKEFYNASKNNATLDDLPFPAWDLFPLENYWKLRFAHGPQTTERYLPLLTSRGCPYRCRFCVTPAVSHQDWRGRTAQNVVDEIEHYVKEYGVTEFHVEDLNPTVSEDRIREICDEILRRDLRVTWKLASGTKAETISQEDTLELMSLAGCRYISISPETGSPRLLQKMGKPFDLQHAISLIGKMNKERIRSQACFVLGFPEENDEDLKMTWNLVRLLTKEGIDEIALFIISPVPGAEIYGIYDGYQSLSELNFTPTWRSDYRKLSRFRLKLYLCFILWKLLYHPGKLMAQPFHFIRRSFHTKMEMVPYRALVLKWRGRKAANCAT